MRSVSRSSDRAQLNPFVALAAVLVLATSLSTFALAFGDVPLPDGERERAEPVLTRAAGALHAGGAVDPAAVDEVDPAVRASVNLTVRARNETWSFGPAAPRDAATASRTVPVRLAPGRVVPGRLRAAVWR